MTTGTIISSLLARLRQHTGLRRYFANTSWIIGERILRMTANLFVGIYVARYLGPERFGALSYAQSFVALFATLAMLGLDGILVRELVASPGRRGELLGTAFRLKLAGSALAMASIAVITWLIDVSNTERGMILIIAVGLVFQSATVIDAHFQARVQSRYVVQAQFAQMIFSSLTKLGLIWLGADLVWFATLIAADSAVLAIGLLFNYRRVEAPPHTRSIPGVHGAERDTMPAKSFFETAKTLISDSWPLILAGIAVSLYMRIDQVMIREMLDTEAVGQYSAAVRLSEAWYFVPVAITQSLFPAVLHARNEGPERYQLRLSRLYGFMVWLGLAVAAFFTLIAEPLIEILYGTAYSVAGPVLAAHIWAGIFVCIGVVSSKYLVAENKALISFWNTAAGAFSNIVLNLFLIPRFGIMGAAIATVVSYALAGYIMLYFWDTTRAHWFNITTSSTKMLVRLFNELKTTK